MAIYVPGRNIFTRQPQEYVYFNPLLIPNALWIGSQSQRDIISGKLPTIVKDVALNYPSSNGLGTYLNSTEQSSTRRMTLASDTSAISIGADNFTVFVMFQSLGNVAGNSYRLPGIMRWNTAAQQNSNEWFLALDNASVTPTFNVEVGISYYSATATPQTIAVGDWFTLIGVRRNTTISVYCKKHKTGSIVSGSTTNANITTVNTGKSVDTYLGEVKGTSLLENMIVPIAGTFKRALTNDEVYQLLDNPWQIFKCARKWFALAGASNAIDLSGSPAASSTATGAITSSLTLSGASIAAATATGVVNSTLSLSGSAASISVANGVATITTTLSGDAFNTVSAWGAIASTMRASGDASATATATGTIHLATTLSGAALAEALASADLDDGNHNVLTGAAHAVTAASANLALDVPILGAATIDVTSSAGLTVTNNLAGAGAVVVTSSGDLTVTGIGLSGDALAEALAGGEITMTIDVSASALAQALAQSTLTVTAMVSNRLLEKYIMRPVRVFALLGRERNYTLAAA